MSSSKRRVIIDSTNSTTELLASGATYSGKIYNLPFNGGWGSISVSAYHNHAGGVDGTLTVRFSTDGVNWVDSNATTIASDTESSPIVYPATSKYYQVVFANGAEDQTEFRLQTLLFEDDLSVSSLLDTISTSPINPIGNSTLGYAANSISSVEVLGGDVTTKKVTITNNTNGTILYVGSNASVTSANGIPLNYLDVCTLTVSNLNKIYCISSGTTDVRYMYEN